jgi:hypothetical protein
MSTASIREQVYDFILEKINKLNTEQNDENIEWFKSVENEITDQQLLEIYHIINVEDYNEDVSKRLYNYILEITTLKDENEEEENEEEENEEEENEQQQPYLQQQPYQLYKKPHKNKNKSVKFGKKKICKISNSEDELLEEYIKSCFKKQLC